jgi:hypothetical protein
MRRTLALAVLLLALPAAAQQPPEHADWPPLTSRFESTGGGGWMIDGYDPVLAGGRCVTDFAAVSPEGQVFRNEVEFDAVPVPGGVICGNGRWRAKDGSGSGTTALRVFIREDGRRFRSP